MISITCKFCENQYVQYNLSRHEEACSKNPKNLRQCPICKKLFFYRWKNQKTCSHSCSNSYFRSGKDHPNWKDESYRTTCFLYHEKKCLICGEDNIVSVHHLDENHKNNSPENLVPLCPTHHQYWHSKYKYMIEQKVLDYILKFKERQLQILLP